MLIIIDVQEYYEDDFKRQAKQFRRMMNEIKKRIKQAIERKEIILNIGNYEDGCTLSEIVSLLRKYDRAHFILKYEEDGSKAINNFLARKKYYPAEIELCGVFRDICVLETWKGLKFLGFNVQPVRKELTMKTYDNWRNITSFPAGYIAR